MFDFDFIQIKWYWMALTILAVILIFSAVGAAVSVLQKRKGMGGKMQTKDVAYAAICIAISLGLSLIPLTFLPFGGSLTLFSTVPIIIYCYYFGFSKGVLICLINMLLQFLREPFVVHPFSFVLDYAIPYMALSVVGLFAYKLRSGESPYNLFKSHYTIFIGSLIYIAIRYISHVTSGVIFYSDFAGDSGALAYSLGYNAIILLDFGIAMIGVIGLLANKSFNTFMASRANALQYSNTATKHN